MVPFPRDPGIMARVYWALAKFVPPENEWNLTVYLCVFLTLQTERGTAGLATKVLQVVLNRTTELRVWVQPI